MASEDKYSRRRLRSSYFSTIISITLVLFMLGLVGLVILNAKKLSDHVKENISFSIFLKDNVKETDIVKLQKTLDAAEYVKSTEYIDREQAMKIFQEEIGEDIGFLGFNPLLASIEVRLKAAYANPDSIAGIEKELLDNQKIKEVHYKKNLVALVNENVRKITIVLLAFSALLLIIAIALINNSIRLAIYTKRFLIRSMQLVGATQSFIRKPFLWKGIFHGIIGALLAIGLLIGIIYSIQKQLPELFELQDVELFASLFGIVLLLGVFISWICTFFAVLKYLRMRPDQLY